MTTIKEALKWSGSGATLSMFVIGRPNAAPELEMSSGQSRPQQVLMYKLEDEAGILSGRQVIEYDAKFSDVPIELDRYLISCLHEALSRGGEVAWFAFEGSFDFDFLLAGDVASQIYALADAAGVVVATDDVLSSETWRKRVVQARDCVL